MFVVEGIPHRLGEVSEYRHPVYGSVESVWFRVVHPDLPAPGADAYEDVFEAVGADRIKEIQAAAKAGAVVRMKVNPVAAISKAGNAWAKMQLVEFLG